METILTLLASTTIVVMGWYVVHRLTTARDLANKRRELRVGYLIEAYRRLENISNRDPEEVIASELERAVADIQLFGSLSQVALVREFCLGFVEKRIFSLDPLLNDLRNDLRRELNLESVSSNVVFLRIGFGKRT
ncbi:MAG: hypothetical protein LV481_16165 [Methylacidiphilales bacterium]|nr:hypothetical protein [Candidatus Methylacidiphilales bacterium]